MMKLLGSPTSPYVRRLRLWLREEACNYDFVSLNIFEGEGRELLKAHNPTLKVPMLLDGEQPVYDSRVIFRYLCQKLGREPLRWEEENRLTVIDAANDSFVPLLLLERSGVDTQRDAMFFRLQRERIERTLELLEAQVADGQFRSWDYPAICLFCLVDWVMMRELYDFSCLPHLRSFRDQQLGRPGVAETDPRHAGV